MNYYSAPEEAMDAPHAMAPWARMALQAAVSAKATKPPKKAAKATAKQTK
jgi:DNA transformation protein